MAGNIKGITIEIGGDTSKLDKALKDVNKTSRELNKELKDIKKSMKFNPDKSTELMAQQQRALAKAIENTQKKLETLKTAQEQAKEALARGDLGQDEYDALTREIMKTENQLKSLKGELNALNSSWSQAGQKMQEFGSKMQKVGDKVTEVGKGLSTKVTAPLTAVGVYATKLSMDFEAAMSEVQAISGATAGDMEKLSATARELGATTTFSAKEAAEGMKYLAMAGWDVNQMTEAMPGLLNLAAASGTELGRTADIVTDSLSGFGMQAQDAGRLADVMAVASSSANTNVEMMGETFKYVAPLAGALGYSVEDVAVVTGLMANSGIKAGQAGTAMRAAFTRLASPTKEVHRGLEMIGLAAEDVQGLSLDETIRTLRNAFSDLDETQKAQVASMLFGQQAMSGMLAVLNASEEEYNALSDAVYDADGAAAQMAATMNDNLSGSLKQLNSAAEEAGISLGEVLAPMIRDLAEKITELVNKFNGLSDKTKENIVKFGLFAAAIGPLLVVLGSIISGAGKVIGVFGGIAEAIGVVANGATASSPAVAGLAKVFSGVIKVAGLLKTALLGAAGVIKGAVVAIATSLGIPVAAVVALGAVIVGLGVLIYKHWDQIKEKTSEVWGSIVEFMSGIWEGISSTWSAVWESIKATLSGIWEGLKSVASSAFEGVKQAISTVWKGIKTVTSTVWNGIKTTLQTIWNSFKVVATSAFNGVKSAIDKVWNAVKTTTTTIWNGIKTAVEAIWNGLKSAATTAFNAVKTAIETVWNTVKSKTTEVWNGIKSTITGIWNGLKSTATSVFDGIKSKVTEVWNNIKSVTKSTWEAVKTAIETPINAAKEAVGKAINAIKGFFSGLKLEIPPIKLPKLPTPKIKGHFSINPPSVPKLSWYDKGGIFKSPTVIGVGEKRPEFVGALDDLKAIVAEVIEKKGNGNGGVLITGNTFVVREEADIKKIAKELNSLQQKTNRGRGMVTT